MGSGGRSWGIAVGVVLGLGLSTWQAGAGAGQVKPAKKQATYIGEKKCFKCHRKKVKAWRETPHAKSWELLPPDARNDTSRDKTGEEKKGKLCVSCHITGYGLPGGPATVKQAEDRKLLGTQCEACHGPGSAHLDPAKEYTKSKAALEKMPEGEEKKKAGEALDLLRAMVSASIDKVPQNACIRCHNPHVSHKR